MIQPDGWVVAGEDVLLDWPEHNGAAALGAMFDLVAGMADDPKDGAVRVPGTKLWIRPVPALPGVIVTYQLATARGELGRFVSVDRVWDPPPG